MLPSMEENMVEEDIVTTCRNLARQAGAKLRAIARELLGRAQRRPRCRTPDPLDAVVGIGEGDGAAIAEHHAERLYGAPVAYKAPSEG